MSDFISYLLVYHITNTNSFLLSQTVPHTKYTTQTISSIASNDKQEASGCKAMPDHLWSQHFTYPSKAALPILTGRFHCCNSRFWGHQKINPKSITLSWALVNVAMATVSEGHHPLFHQTWDHWVSGQKRKVMLVGCYLVHFSLPNKEHFSARKSSTIH